MTRSRSGPHDMQALRALVREARALKVPAIDWERVERGILAEVEAPPRLATVSVLAQPPSSVPARAPAAPPSSYRALFGVALAAACAALLVTGASPTSKRASGSALAVAENAVRAPSPFAREDRAGILFDASSLRVGDVIEAPSHPMSYEHEGAVTWTLAPRSSARVVNLGASGDGTITLALVSGAVHAEVTHRDRGEVFAVEVGRTRVAVHGTSFTVTRDGDRAVVDVAHGSVAVGPVGHPGSTEGWLLVGPERASFSLDGAEHVAWLAEVADADASLDAELGERAVSGPSSSRPSIRAATAGKVESARPMSASTQPNGDARTPGASLALPEELTEADWSPEASRIVAQVADCFERRVANAGDVAFSIQSSLSFTNLAGRVDSRSRLLPAARAQSHGLRRGRNSKSALSQSLACDAREGSGPPFARDSVARPVRAAC